MLLLHAKCSFDACNVIRFVNLLLCSAHKRNRSSLKFEFGLGRLFAWSLNLLQCNSSAHFLAPNLPVKFASEFKFLVFSVHSSIFRFKMKSKCISLMNMSCPVGIRVARGNSSDVRPCEFAREMSPRCQPRPVRVRTAKFKCRGRKRQATWPRCGSARMSNPNGQPRRPSEQPSVEASRSEFHFELGCATATPTKHDERLIIALRRHPASVRAARRRAS